MKPGSLVRVLWDDHTFIFGRYDGGWGGRDLSSIESVGYLVYVDDRAIAIAMSRDGDSFAETQVIDRRMVRSLRRIREGCGDSPTSGTNTV